MQQNRTWIKKELERRKSYADLFWCIQAKTRLNEYAMAAYPGEWTPVIPVGDDPRVSEHYAHLLLELVREDAPKRYELAYQLTDKNCLEETKTKWYIWGEIDEVCLTCGTVGYCPDHTGLLQRLTGNEGEYVQSEDNQRIHETSKG